MLEFRKSYREAAAKMQWIVFQDLMLSVGDQKKGTWSPLSPWTFRVHFSDLFRNEFPVVRTDALDHVHEHKAVGPECACDLGCPVVTAEFQEEERLSSTSVLSLP